MQGDFRDAPPLVPHRADAELVLGNVIVAAVPDGGAGVAARPAAAPAPIPIV
jgi:hypothetical protein